MWRRIRTTTRLSRSRDNTKYLPSLRAQVESRFSGGSHDAKVRWEAPIVIPHRDIVPERIGFTADLTGSYLFRLTATDRRGLPGSARRGSPGLPLDEPAATGSDRVERSADLMEI